MYKRNEYSTMLQKEGDELMHTGNKEYKQYGYIPSCIAKWVFPVTVLVSTYIALGPKEWFPLVKHWFPLGPNLYEDTSFDKGAKNMRIWDVFCYDVKLSSQFEETKYKEN